MTAAECSGKLMTRVLASRNLEEVAALKKSVWSERIVRCAGKVEPSDEVRVRSELYGLERRLNWDVRDNVKERQGTCEGLLGELALDEDCRVHD